MWTVTRDEVPASPTDREGGVDWLFRAYGLEMLRLAQLLVDDRETAEDVVQDAFAGLYQHWPDLDAPERALGYLRRSGRQRGAVSAAAATDGSRVRAASRRCGDRAAS